MSLDKILHAIDAMLARMRQELSSQPLLRAYTRIRGLQLARAGAWDIYIHDLQKVVTVDFSAMQWHVADASPDSARAARYVMCSQVAWYTFAFAWGGDATQISGMYLDRQHAESGPHPFFTVQEAIAVEAFRTPQLSAWPRVAQFWWRKKAEIVLRPDLVRGYRPATPRSFSQRSTIASQL